MQHRISGVSTEGLHGLVLNYCSVSTVFFFNPCARLLGQVALLLMFSKGSSGFVLAGCSAHLGPLLASVHVSICILLLIVVWWTTRWTMSRLIFFLSPKSALVKCEFRKRVVDAVCLG